jgi:hypothetical protein
MNPFTALSQIQQAYLTYVRTFQRFQNPEIHDWVMERIEHGTLLWKPPFVQLSRPFATGDALEALIGEGLLHPGVLPVFRAAPDDPTSPPPTGSERISDPLRDPPATSGSVHPGTLRRL